MYICALMETLVTTAILNTGSHKISEKFQTAHVMNVETKCLGPHIISFRVNLHDMLLYIWHRLIERDI